MVGSWAMNVSNLNSFIQEFDIQFGEWEYGMRQATVPSESPLSGPEKIKSLYTHSRYYVRSLNNASTMPMAFYDNGRALAFISKHKGLNKGKLIVTGEMGMLGKTSAGGHIEQADNEEFVKNLLAYIKGSVDLSVMKVIVKGRNIVAGDSVKVVTVLKNLGAMDSSEVKVWFALFDVIKLTGEPKNEIKMLKTTMVNSVPAGKKSRLSQIVKIPTFAQPDEYLLLVEVNPVGINIDSEPGNNIKFSKKFIVQ